jgi:hypothetical protein
MAEKSVIDALVANPTESLSVELKRWIDPTQPAAVEKFVKSLFALRNRNGGYLVIGFDNKTYQPDLANEPSNTRELFHPDRIQGVVSKYAADPFEVEIAWGERDGREYPVIVVAPGVRTPVATKRDLLDGKRVAIREGAVYFRTLSSNGTPSSAEAKPSDWKDIVDICAENREADIGRFLRRHLGDASGNALISIGGPPRPTMKAQTVTLLDDGISHFTRAASARNLSKTDTQIANGAKFEVALLIDPLKSDELPTVTFHRTLAASNPELTGWPIWLDSSGFRDQTAWPVVKDGVWEAFILSGQYLDFYRFDPNGKFYLLRNLQDDTGQKAPAGTVLDPINVILSVAETIAAGLAFARGLGWTPEETKLRFAFRWSGLAGRKLESWANPGVYVRAYQSTATDTVTSYVEVSLETSTSAIAPAVQTVVKELFAQFGGYEFPTSSIEAWVKKLIERRL